MIMSRVRAIKKPPARRRQLVIAIWRLHRLVPAIQTASMQTAQAIASLPPIILVVTDAVSPTPPLPIFVIVVIVVVIIVFITITIVAFFFSVFFVFILGFH